MILGYCRVSTTEQAADGTTSLQEQERIIRGYAMTKGITAFDLQIYVDSGVSGSIALRNRPAGEELLEAVKPGDIVVASKLDRIFRNSLDALWTYNEFKNKGIHLVLFDMGVQPITDDGGLSKVFFSIMSAFADHERERIRERILDGKRAKKLKGGHTGGVAPFGYRVVGQRREARLEIDEHEQEIVREIAALRHLPIPALVRQINAKGLKTRKGKPFIYAQVERILKTSAHAVH